MQMAIMDGSGDIKIEWNPDNKEESEVAENAFKELFNKSWLAFRMYDGGKRGEQMSKFDKFAERIILVPPLAGG